MNRRTTSTVIPLYEGTFSVGTDKKFNPIGREESAAKGALKISLNPFLIRSGEHNILFDTGIGDFGEGTSTDTLKENLADQGISEYEVTDIFCSHLHYDHIGGLAGRSSGFWELTFPEANVWVSKGGWRKVMNLDTYYDEEKTQFVHFLDAKAKLKFLEDRDRPCPRVTTRTIGGHTEYSQLLLFEDEDQRFMMAGDVLATRGAVNRKYAAKYDYDPDRSMELRKELSRKAYEEGYTLMAYHETHGPLFNISGYDERRGFLIDKEAEHVPT